MSSSGILAGTVAIVTGALGDIGSAIILELLHEGATVLGVDLNLAGAETKAAWGASIASGSLKFAKGNVTLEEDVRAYNQQAITLFGRLDIVVLSAGILPKPTPWVDCDVSQFDRGMAINTKGVFFGAKHAAITMKPFAEERKAEGGGSIIIISSIAGIRARPTTSPYATSKFAVRGLCLTLAQELAPWHIRVNAVFPGVTDSAMLRALPEDYRMKAVEGVPMLRAGTTKEQGSTVAFLASSQASYVNGVNWPVHGGICPS